ncbi:unnamed protein product [Dibothriocephalus latus]|uniref:DUF4806 domain-containing protein n=1 Tax=Dibothriocephalus latus TaxID=60516 RepID=A0A3P7N3F4_DIBLA|nr:unnamed protein product [Dibothriocephalus latus]
MEFTQNTNWPCGFPELRSEATETPQGQVADVKAPEPPPLQPAFRQTDTVMPDVDWLRYIATAISDMEHRITDRIASMEQSITGQLTAMDGRLAAMDGRLTVMDGRLDTLEKGVLQRSTQTTAEMTSLRAECPVPSPMSSLEEFDSFEGKLRDKQFRQQTVAFLRTLGGWRVRDFVKRLLEPLFTSRLLANFNLTGQFGRRNFRRTRAYVLLEDVFRKWAEDHHYAHPQDFETAIRSLLRSAKASR